MSEIYEIIDYSFYDASSSSNLSKYTAPSDATMTYDSTNNCYTCTKTQTNATTTILLDNVTFSNRCIVKADIYLATRENIQARLGLWNGNNGITSRAIASVGGNTTYFGISSQTKGDDGTNLVLDQNIGITTGVWYTLELTYDNGSVTSKLLNGDTVIDTLTASESTLGSTGNNFGIDVGFTINNVIRVKNIRIQEL